MSENWSKSNGISRWENIYIKKETAVKSPSGGGFLRIGPLSDLFSGADGKKVGRQTAISGMRTRVTLPTTVTALARVGDD